MNATVAGGTAGMHAPHHHVALPKNYARERTPVQVAALAQLRAALPLSNTPGVLDWLSHHRHHTADKITGLHVYCCELTGQFIYMLVARCGVIRALFTADGQLVNLTDPRMDKVVRHAVFVSERLEQLFLHEMEGDQPLCSEGERNLYHRALQEGWAGTTFLKLLAEVRVTVMGWSTMKLGLFLRSALDLASLESGESEFDWASLPIMSAAFFGATASKSIGYMWKWGSVTAATVTGLSAMDCEQALHAPLKRLNEHLKVLISSNGMDFARDEMDQMLGDMFHGASGAWKAVHASSLDAALGGMGGMALNPAQGQQQQQQQNPAAGGNHQHFTVAEALVEYVGNVDDSWSLPVNVMEHPSVELALYATTNLTSQMTLQEKQHVEAAVPGDAADLEQAILMGPTNEGD